MMYDKFFDLKGDALEERRERRKLGEVAYYHKLRFNNGYVVRSVPKDVYVKLWPKSSVQRNEVEK